MTYTDYTEEAISMRLEGKECLSWGERFAYDIIKRNLYRAEPESCSFAIIMKIDRNLFSAYYCYFFTNSDAASKFMILRYMEGKDNTNICKLMEDVGWDTDMTKDWWNEVFYRGRIAKTDASLLRNGQVKATEGSSMNMETFLMQLEEKIDCIMEGLKIHKYDPVFHVYLGGDFAGVMPLIYVINRMYGRAATAIVNTPEDIFCDINLSYRDVAQTFFIPWRLREMQLNISPAMTLTQVAATNGISIPIPVSVKDKNSKEIESVLLTDKPIAGYEHLSWGDLIVNDGCADLQLDDYFFKDMMLSVVPDGYGTYYIGNVNDCKHRITLN